MTIFAGTIFSSAFLLFLVQPIIAKQILPWFGGTSMVWTICLVFFQGVLLAGYTYSDWISRNLAPRAQALLHILLLVTALITLPIVADSSWKPNGNEDPTWRILGLLLSTVGLPYFLLSTTGPLVQSWCASIMHSKTVYRLFSLSNLASLLALVCYPFLIEPHALTLWQSRAWSAVFGVFVFLCSGTALLFVWNYRHEGKHTIRCVSPADEGEAAPTASEMILWLSLSGMGSWMLLAISNHITQNVASIPFLWILPLTIYLLTFVFCFEREGWYRRNLYLIPVTLILGICAWGLQTYSVTLAIKIAIPLYMAGLFLICMFLHGELAGRKPGTRYLTRFYLMLSLGGALGGMLVGLVAPRILPALYELGIGFVLTALLAAFIFYPQNRKIACGAVIMSLLCGFFLYIQISDEFSNTRVVTRNFYGALRTRDRGSQEEGKRVRQLKHGAILHGEQFLDPAKRKEATTYYGATSGVGKAILNLYDHPIRVGVIGMGTATLAVYGRPGDYFRFYEINPQVVDLAQREFTFLTDGEGKNDIVLGDARLSLEREAVQSFDLLAVDAFSGDSIPVHLLTREAMEIYLRHLKTDGVLAFHVTNRFLKLAPVVRALATHFGMEAVRVYDEAEDSHLYRSDWVLVSRNKALLARENIAAGTTPIDEIAGLDLWTDDFNNLFDVLK
ncbi:MAG: fused MFS/spermidine synthase [Pseudomonadota bacterium]